MSAENPLEESHEKISRDRLAESDRNQKRDQSDLRKLLNLPEGRRFIWKLWSETGVFRASFTLNSNQTAFNEGRRDIGLAILLEVQKAKPDAYAQMQREFTSEINSLGPQQSAVKQPKSKEKPNV